MGNTKLTSGGLLLQRALGLTCASVEPGLVVWRKLLEGTGLDEVNPGGQLHLTCERGLKS